MTNKPIRRHPALQNLSREHHDILVFALRIKKGISKNANLEDLDAYCNWFWVSYLQNHFQLEEQHLFPLLKNESGLIINTVKQHQELESLFKFPFKNYTDYTEVHLLLEKNIRFEERELFNLMQKVVIEELLEEFKKRHTKQQVCGVWNAEFWK